MIKKDSLTPMKKERVDIAIGVVLALMFFVLYIFTQPMGATLGVSATFILHALDLFPRLTLSATFWHTISAALARVSGSHAVSVLNASSAAYAALALGFLYALMRNGVLCYLDRYAVHEGRARFVSIMAGAVSVFSLGLSAPFWSMATRAHMMSFDILLLLLAAWLLVSFIRSGWLLYAMVLTLFYGVFAAQFSTMIVVAPMFAIGMLYALWRHEVLLARRLVLLGALLWVGIVLGYGLSAFLYYRSPGSVLHGYDGFWNVLWALWGDQANQIMRSLPREGWLIILFTTTVPWLTMFTVARRGLNDDRDKALLLLHVIMTICVCGLWLHVPLTPWRLLGWRRLLMTPYVLVAMVTGYLAVFWFLLAGQWRLARESGFKALMRFFIGGVLTLLLLGVAFVLPWWFADEAQPREAALAHDIAADVVESLEGRTWLVSNGLLDAHYYLVAWERDIPLKILSMPSGNQQIYLRYLAELFEDVRLQNAAHLSIHALLQELLGDPERAADIAVLHEPDLWRRAGYEVLPQRMVYVGVDADTFVLDPAIAGSTVGFLDDMFRRRKLPEGEDQAAIEHILRWSAMHAGRLGNDLGVLLEDAGNYEQAWSVYDAVLRLDPDNISSLLNLYSMVSAGRAQDPDGLIAARFAAFEEELPQRLQIWSLVRTYGVVRAPEAFAQMGWSWAYSGQPRAAVSQVERASALAGETRSPALEALMAEVYLLDGRPVESATIYRRMVQDPDQRLRGLAGLYRLALRMQRVGAARDLLAQMARAGMPEDRVVLEEVMLDILDGNAEAALARVDDFLVEHRSSLRGWVLMAEAGFLLDDARAVDRALRRIELQEGVRGYYASMIRARMAFKGADFIRAAEYYETALSRRPGHRPLLEELLRLNLLLLRRDPAQRYMHALLHMDPSHALALYVRGSLQIADGNLRLAEDSLRRSLESSRSPMALNDLAWILSQRKAYEEAEALVREALEINDQQAVAWNTLGVVLMRTGRLGEAEAALSRSISLDGSSASVRLYLAELQILRGRADAAREILAQFEGYYDRLSDPDRALFLRLQDALPE